MENMLSHGKGAAFFPHVSQGTLGAHQQLRIDITGCANMWGEYRDSLICTVRSCRRVVAWGSGNLTLALTSRLSLLQHPALRFSNLTKLWRPWAGLTRKGLALKGMGSQGRWWQPVTSDKGSVCVCRWETCRP